MNREFIYEMVFLSVIYCGIFEWATLPYMIVITGFFISTNHKITSAKEEILKAIYYSNEVVR